MKPRVLVEFSAVVVKVAFLYNIIIVIFLIFQFQSTPSTRSHYSFYWKSLTVFDSRHPYQAHQLDEQRYFEILHSESIGCKVNHCLSYCSTSSNQIRSMFAQSKKGMNLIKNTTVFQRELGLQVNSGNIVFIKEHSSCVHFCAAAPWFDTIADHLL